MRQTSPAFSSVARLSILALLLLALPAVRADDGEKEASRPGESEQLCIKKWCFPATATVGSQVLPARGAGLLRYWGFDVYAAALYVAPEVKDVPAELGKQPMKLSIRYFRSIDKDDLARSTEELVECNPGNDVAKLRERLDRLYGLYRDVKKGDVYEIAYVPGNGTTLLFNGQEEATFEGEDFARAFLGIWLSNHPADRSLQSKLTTPRGEDRKDRR